MVSELRGEKLFSRISQIIPEIDAYLSKVITHAYKNPILIPNPVLSRNPFSSSLLLRIALELPCRNLRFVRIKLIDKLAKYYVKNLIFLCLYLVNFLTFKVSKLRFRREEVGKSRSLIIVNTFTMIDKIYPKKRFEDDFFGEIYEIMSKRGKQYVIFCFLFGDKALNFRRRVETYNIIANDQRNFVTEFEIMQLRDWFALVKFILVYPLLTVSLMWKEFGKFDRFLREEIIETLDSVHFHEYVRYLVGRRLSRLTNRKLKVISWWENLVIDKMLFRGIRDGIADAELFGCQFFAKCPHWTNLYPLDEEIKYGTLPDVVMVSGEYYLGSNPALNVKSGISPRYNYLFAFQLQSRGIPTRDGLLLLLPYSVGDSKRIIKLVKDYQIVNRVTTITVKFHPNHLLAVPFEIPKNWKHTEESLGVLCPKASAVITSESSAALEAAVMGCSVVIVGSDDGLTFNPMPEYGRGEIWDLVFDGKELQQAVTRLSEYRQEKPGEIVALSQKLRDMFFTQATEEKYVELFDL